MNLNIFNRGTKKKTTAKIDPNYIRPEFDTSPEVIAAALKRPKLKNLKAGARLKQKKLGESVVYKYPKENGVCLFVRYLTEEERTAENFTNATESNRVRDLDIIVSPYVDKRNAEVILFAADSSFFEVVK